VYTGWSTKVLGSLFHVIPHEVLVPLMGWLSQDLFVQGKELDRKYEQIARKGRESRQ
jgi:hypothetical protein